MGTMDWQGEVEKDLNRPYNVILHPFHDSGSRSSSTVIKASSTSVRLLVSSDLVYASVVTLIPLAEAGQLVRAPCHRSIIAAALHNLHNNLFTDQS